MKKVLPRLIISALLINFSFVIAQYIILTSNSFVGFFVPRPSNTSQSILVSEQIAAGFQPQRLFAGPAVADLDSEKKAELKRLDETVNSLYFYTYYGFTEKGVADEMRRNNLIAERQAIRDAQVKNVNKYSVVLDALITEVFGIIFFAVAFFVSAALASSLL